jgi:hypothetical protein
MFPLTNGTAFDVVFVDSPIFNRNIVHGITNMIQRKYSITATNSSEGCIDTTNLPQRTIGQSKGILGFIVDYHHPPNNNNVMITSMCSHHWYDKRKFHIPFCKFLKYSSQNKLVVLNLIFLRRIQRLFLNCITFSTRL